MLTGTDVDLSSVHPRSEPRRANSFPQNLLQNLTATRPPRLVAVVVLLFSVASLVSDVFLRFGEAGSGTGTGTGAVLPLTAVLLCSYLPPLLATRRVEFAVAAQLPAVVVLIELGEPLALLVPVLLVGACVGICGRWGLVASHAVVVLGWLTAWILTEPVAVEGIVWLVAPLSVASVLVPRWIARLLRRQKADARAIDDLGRRAAVARAGERRLLAQELHDIVAHDVTVIAMQARMAGYLAEGERKQDVLDTISGAAQNTLDDLRRLVTLLGEEPGHRSGVAGRLEDEAPSSSVHAELDQIRSHLEAVGIPTVVDVRGEVEGLPTSVRQVVRRTARECSTNVLKHAGTGAHARLDLEVGHDEVLFRCLNSAGSGAAPRGPALPSGGFGLSGIRERARIFDGSCRSGPEGDGWRVELVVPVHTAAGTRPATGSDGGPDGVVP